VTEQAWRKVIEVVERAYPREACGWLAGGGDEVREVEGGGEHGFAFGDAALIELARADGVTAIFHSHPDGDETLSAADVAAMELLGGLPQLVVAVAGGRARTAAMWTLERGAVTEVGRWTR
jgi:proteasome lid subunit RPN8/RPN11